MIDDTPWLDDEEMRIWRGFLHASVRIPAQLSDSLKSYSGLTMDDYEVLVHLSENDPQRLRMSELSHRLVHSQSRLTQLAPNKARPIRLTRQRFELG